MATMDDMGNVAYYDIIPFYGNPDKGSIARWPKQLLDDVKYVYLGKEISLSMALALLSRMTDIPDRNYLKEAMVNGAKPHRYRTQTNRRSSAACS